MITPEEGVNGEYCNHYDNFGNTALMTDADGDRQYAALSNDCYGKTVSVWNPNSLEIVNQAQGINRTVSLNITSGLSIVVAGSKGSLVTTNYNATLAGVNSTRTFCYWGEDGDFLPFSPNKPSFPCYVPADCERLFSDENDGTDMKSDLKENYSNCTLAYYCSRVLDRLSFEEEYEAYIDYLQAQQLPEGEDRNASLENALKHINVSVKYDKQANNCQDWLDKHPGCKNNL